MKRSFNNTGRLVLFLFRRERFSSSLWIVLISAFCILLAPMLGGLFDAPAREALLYTINNPAMIGMLGPIYGIENYTIGAMYFNMMVQWIMIAVAIMNIMLVVRHTRGDEERGRIDIIHALPTGRLASLSAVLLTAVIVNLLIAVIAGFGIAALGIESMSLIGALLFGCTLGAVGMVFAAIAAVFSQLCSTSRGAVGFSLLTIGFFYLLRGAGDLESEVLSLISPLGLAQRTQAFVENYWLPIVILLAEAVVFALIAFLLNTTRDIRQGLIPQRNGREAARPYLLSPYGLAFRLLQTPFFGWIIGMYIIGLAYGSILGTIDNFVQSSEFYSIMIGANPDFSTAQMFVSMVATIMALIAVVPVLMIMLKLRTEEKDGYFQHVLSRSVSRYSYMSSYIITAAVTGVIVQLATSLGIYTAAVAVLPDSDTLTLSYLLKANLVYVPALLVMLGIAVLLIGALPRLTSAIWAYFAFSFFVSFIGRLPGAFPEWVQKLTPFYYIPSLPVDEINYTTLAILTLIGILLSLAGLFAYKKRDIVS